MLAERLKHSPDIYSDIITPIPYDYATVEEVVNVLEREPQIISEENKQRLRELQVESSVVGTDNEKFLMKETGFEVSKQIAMYLRIKEENPELSNSTINEIFATNTSPDFLGYYWEFLKREPVLVNQLSLQQNESVTEIYGKKHDQKLLDVIAGDEREGAIIKAISHLQENLHDAKPNTLFAIHSPAGWAKDGNSDLPDDQIYLYRLDEERSLTAITLRLSISLEDHEQIMRNLTNNELFKKNLDHKSRLIRASSSIMQLEDTSFEAYLNIIERQTGSKEAWRDVDKKGKHIKTHTFSEIRKQLKDISGLTVIDDDIYAIANRLSLYIKQDIDFSDPQNLRSLVITMGTAALDMQDILERQNGYEGEKDYTKLHTRAQEYGGCVTFSTKGGLSPSQLESQGFKKEGRCRICNKTAIGSNHKTWIGKCRICYHCQGTKF